MATAIPINLWHDGWTSALSTIYLDMETDKCYSDSACTAEIDAVPVPTRTSTTDTNGYKFLGYYSSTVTTSTLYIDENGNILDALRTLTLKKTIAIYCPSVVCSYRITLDDNEGSGGDAAIWRIKTATTSDYFFVEQSCETPVTNVSLPVREGYTFEGYYDGTTTPGAQYIDATGEILSSLSSLTAAARTIYAKWTANTYTLTFDYTTGSGTVESMEVTYGSVIGALPAGVHSRAGLAGWTVDEETITASTVWAFAGDKTAVAVWDFYFGHVTDYFSLGSSTLVPESSDSGDTHQHTCAYNATSETATTETSGIWRNPRVTYRVVGDTTLAVILGKAWSATNSGTTMTVSGYMITSVEIDTTLGDAPVVTVQGTANEGADAVKTYAVSIPISARHHPQNLLSAVSGGGELQSLTLTASGDPVVVAEGGMPCASDMTHGHIEVTAKTAAYNGETAPTAGTGFTLISEPVSHSGTGYAAYSVAVRKEIV